MPHQAKENKKVELLRETLTQGHDCDTMDPHKDCIFHSFMTVLLRTLLLSPGSGVSAGDFVRSKGQFPASNNRGNSHSLSETGKRIGSYSTKMRHAMDCKRVLLVKIQKDLETYKTLSHFAHIY